MLRSSARARSEATAASWPRRAFSGAERIRGGKRLGIQIHGKKENFRLVKIRAYKTTEAIGPCDLVLIALKATNNDVLPDLIPPLLHETTVLLLQNGLGNEEFLARHFGAERVAGGLCFICVNRVAPSVIEHFDYGSLTIGEFTGLPKPRTHNIASEFKRCGVVCAVVENLCANAGANWFGTFHSMGFQSRLAEVRRETFCRMIPLYFRHWV